MTENPPPDQAQSPPAPEHRPDDYILQAQKKLSGILSSARSSEDRDLAREVRVRGERVSRLLHGLLRLSKLHLPTNRAFDRPVCDLADALRGLIELLGPAQLVCVEGQVYMNDLRLRFDTEAEQAKALGEFLNKHNVGGIIFNEPVDDDRIRRLVGALSGKPEATRPRTGIQQKLIEEGLETVELLPHQQFLIDHDEEDRGFGDVYRSAAGMVAGVFANMGARRLPSPLPVRRAIHEMLDLARSEKGPWGAFAADQQVPPFSRHTLMVTDLSVLIGRSAGLSETSLADLGMAAMYHDVGLCVGEGSDPETYRRHSHSGLGVLLKQRGFHPAKIQRLLAVAEHHRRCDHHFRPSLFARIIHIADDYDIMTRPRDRSGSIQVPPDALRLMASQTETYYDPILFQLFVNALGAYPPGTLLQLDDGRVVISVSGARKPEWFSQPMCHIVRLADGGPPSEETPVDLAIAGRVRGVVRPSQPAG